MRLMWLFALPACTPFNGTTVDPGTAAGPTDDEAATSGVQGRPDAGDAAADADVPDVDPGPFQPGPQLHGLGEAVYHMEPAALGLGDQHAAAICPQIQRRI